MTLTTEEQALHWKRIQGLLKTNAHLLAHPMPNSDCCHIGEGYVHVHIPRTGGTAFRSRYGLPSGGRHFPARAWESFRTFTFIRNPHDRLVSLFRLLAFREPTQGTYPYTREGLENWFHTELNAQPPRTLTSGLPILSPQKEFVLPNTILFPFQFIRAAPRVWRHWYSNGFYREVYVHYRDDFSLESQAGCPDVV